MVKRTFRISDELDQKINKAVKDRGFANPSAFFRASLEALVREKSTNAAEIEERVSVTLDRIARDLFRVQRAQQAHFAVTDTLIRPSSRVCRNRRRM